MTSNAKLPRFQTLEQRLEYLQHESVISIDFYRGWYEEVIDLCIQIDRMLGIHQPFFHWVQLNEEAAQCRLFFSLRPLNPNSHFEEYELNRPNENLQNNMGRIRAQAQHLVDLASLKMKSKCCICGEDGVLAHDGEWLITLCEFDRPAVRAAHGETRPLHKLLLRGLDRGPKDIRIGRSRSDGRPS